MDIETLTPGEARAMLAAITERDRPQRVRATQLVKLDGTGAGQVEVYSVPIGFEFEARRVTLDLDTASDPSTGNVALNVAGKYVAYQRSGTRIEYAVPGSPAGIASVPGVQTWGDQQGPYLRNGEVFEARAVGLTANALLTCTVEGILRRAPGDSGRKRGDTVPAA
jgi:hypothetical protein